MRQSALISVVVAIGAAFAPALVKAAVDGPKLGFPLACEIGRSCEIQHYVDRDPGPGVLDYHCGHRTYDKHNGIDIRLLDMAAQRRGVDVLAAAPGRVARLRDGVTDISVRAPGAPSVVGQECGNGVVIDHGDGWETQYCHVAKDSVRVKVGDVVKAGTPIARVGLSGQTEFPHLHLTVRHAGTIVDPFAPAVTAPGSCTAQASMWTPAAAKALAYKAGTILNAGFAAAPVTNETIEAGGIAAPTPAAAALIAYMRVAEPQVGDELEITLTGPDGAPLATNRLPPLDRDKAQYFTMLGRKRPPGGWKPGRYSAELKVWRAGKVALEKRIETSL
jgi:hypothetical protein